MMVFFMFFVLCVGVVFWLGYWLSSSVLLYIVFCWVQGTYFVFVYHTVVWGIVFWYEYKVSGLLLCIVFIWVL